LVNNLINGEIKQVKEYNRLLRLLKRMLKNNIISGQENPNLSQASPVKITDNIVPIAKNRAAEEESMDMETSMDMVDTNKVINKDNQDLEMNNFD
jgi:hypothetical protein